MADNSDSVGDSWDNITSFMYAFIDQLNYASGGPRLAIVTFSGPPIGQGSNWVYDPAQATNVLIDFSDDVRALRSAVRTRALHYGMTCISCGIDVAAERIRASSRYGVAEPVVILLTDGEQTVGGTSQRAVDSATAMRSTENVKFFGVSYQTIAGNPAAMQAMVTPPHEVYFMVRPPPDHCSLLDLAPPCSPLLPP